VKTKFNTKHRAAQKSAGPAAIAAFATIVNPALSMAGIPLCTTLSVCVLFYKYVKPALWGMLFFRVVYFYPKKSTDYFICIWFTCCYI